MSSGWGEEEGRAMAAVAHPVRIPDLADEQARR